MKIIMISGYPASGKTSLIQHLVSQRNYKKKKMYFAKIDCLYAYEGEIFKNLGLASDVFLSEGYCPDHYLSNIFSKMLSRIIENHVDYAFIETAGLCARCSPYFRNFLSLCVVDATNGIHSLTKMGPLLTEADIIVATKSDLVSHSESEIYSFELSQMSKAKTIIFVDGRTGQGIYKLVQTIEHYFENIIPKVKFNSKLRLRFPLPKFLCSYCFGRKNIRAL